jgi:hypothetical protein
VIEEQLRRRVRRWFSRRGRLDPDDARVMLAGDNSGFSLDASVCIAGHDRAGLERLLRYCACYAKQSVLPLVALAWVVYLSLPFSVPPSLVVLPFAALSALSVSIMAGTFKKYL